MAKNEVKRRWLMDCTHAALRHDFSVAVVSNTGRKRPERQLASLDDAKVWLDLVERTKAKNRGLAALLEEGSRIDVYQHHKIARIVITKVGFEQLLRNPMKRDLLASETLGLLGDDYSIIVMPLPSENAAFPLEGPQNEAQKMLDTIPIRKSPRTFDEAKQAAPDGTPFWDARELAELLGYSGLTGFLSAIEKSKSTYQQAGLDVHAHIREVSGDSARKLPRTIHLSEMGAYLAIQVADTSIREVAQGHVYFAQLIFQQRTLNQGEKDITRIERREELKDVFKRSNKVLFTKKLGYCIARYHDAGHRGFYNMGKDELLVRRGLKPDDNIFDYSTETELWGNGLFRSMANDEIEATPNLTADQAAQINWKHGDNIRQAFARGGLHNLPENLPIAENIKDVEKRVAKSKGKQPLIGQSGNE